jgi:hypothetical protein
MASFWAKPFLLFLTAPPVAATTRQNAEFASTFRVVTAGAPVRRLAYLML